MYYADKPLEQYTKPLRITGHVVKRWLAISGGGVVAEGGGGGAHVLRHPPQPKSQLIPSPAGDIKNFLKNEKIDQVIVIVKSCTPNVLGDLTITLKDLSGGSEMLNEEEIMKLLEEEEEMADLELQVCGNVNDEEDQYKLDKEALNFALEKEAKGDTG
uniref:Uncharacterized protein n=1 Tax=Tanacetum cinerariifolium TaxID=118510 RepID=A0A6L2KLK5_TANCI|nr:hypothetical protein [Tanacetum cinerariifolium]